MFFISINLTVNVTYGFLGQLSKLIVFPGIMITRIISITIVHISFKEGSNEY